MLINDVDWSYYGPLIHESEELVESFGIEIPEFISYDIVKSDRKWGDWSLKDGCHYIRVAKRLLDTGNDHAIKETLIHEILHACYPHEGHRKGWKRAAKLISDSTDYRISRLSSEDDKGIQEDEINWMFKIECTNCGTRWFYTKPKNVRAIVRGRCMCSKCKSKKFKVINKFGEEVK